MPGAKQRVGVPVMRLAGVSGPGMPPRAGVPGRRMAVVGLIGREASGSAGMGSVAIALGMDWCWRALGAETLATRPTARDHTPDRT